MVCIDLVLRVQRINGASAAITASWKGSRELERTFLATGDAETAKKNPTAMRSKASATELGLLFC